MFFVITVIILAFAIYLYIAAIHKLNSIKSEVITEEAKEEIQSLIVEFNKAAVRNIELMEDKIETMKKLIDKANKKIVQLDEKIARINKPIVVEKVVYNKNSNKKSDEAMNNLSHDKEKVSENKVGNNNKTIKSENSEIGKTNTVRKQLSREDLLKKLIKEGKEKEELLEMGFVEQEINLVRFIMKNK